MRLSELNIKVITNKPLSNKILTNLFLNKGGSWAMFEPRENYSPRALIFKKEGLFYSTGEESLSDFLNSPEELVSFTDAEIILRNCEKDV